MTDLKAEIIRIVRVFLDKLSWKKILTFSFFVLLATIFWFMQIYREPFTATLYIPLKYINIPDSIVFDNDLPQGANITIEEDGGGLFRYFLTKRHDTLSIDVSNFIASNKNAVLQNASYEELLKTKLLTSSRIRSYSPARISFEYSILSSKKIPVIFDGQVIIDPGYLLNGDITINPDSVMVYGSEETLKYFMYAYTNADTIKNLTKTTTTKVNIKGQKNIKFIPSNIELTIPIDKFTEKDVIVPIRCINLPSDIDIKIFPSSAHVSFSVGLSQFKEITEKDFIIELDYNNLKNIETMSTPIRLTTSPSHIYNITLNPIDVEFIFEKKTNR